MVTRSALRYGPAVFLAAALSFAALSARPFAAPQDGDRTCFVCHGDEELVSAAGKPVFVRAQDYADSVHGRAGVGCIGCHADLKGFEDFPHPAGLKAVECAGCHADYARTSPGGVHGTSSPRLAAKPVLCKDCHGYHDALTSSDPRSSVHAPRRPATCGKCHEGAGGNFSRGRVHELASTAGRSPAGVVRVLYKALIGVMTAFFLAYVGADLVRWRRER